MRAMIVRSMDNVRKSDKNPIVFEIRNPIKKIRRKDGGLFCCEFEEGEKSWERILWCVEEEKYDKEKSVKEQADFGFSWDIGYICFADANWLEFYQEAEKKWREEKREGER